MSENAHKIGRESSQEIDYPDTAMLSPHLQN